MTGKDSTTSTSGRNRIATAICIGGLGGGLVALLLGSILGPLPKGVSLATSVMAGLLTAGLFFFLLFLGRHLYSIYHLPYWVAPAGLSFVAALFWPTILPRLAPQIRQRLSEAALSRLLRDSGEAIAKLHSPSSTGEAANSPSREKAILAIEGATESLLAIAPALRDDGHRRSTSDQIELGIGALQRTSLEERGPWSAQAVRALGSIGADAVRTRQSQLAGASVKSLAAIASRNEEVRPAAVTAIFKIEQEAKVRRDPFVADSAAHALLQVRRPSAGHD